MKEDKEGMFATNVECSRCKTIFPIFRENVNFDKLYEDKDGQSIFITYFDCPSCKERHYVQIDDQKSRKLKKETQRWFVKLSAMRNKNKQISKQQQDKFKKLRNDLSNSRLELMKQYEGSIVTDTETGKAIELNFTVV